MQGKMKLLVAHDGSSGADATLDDLKRAGLPREGVATVLSVTDLWLPPMKGPIDPCVSERLVAASENARARVAAAVEEARDITQRFCARLQVILPGWEVRAEACAGSPGWEIIREAEASNADLIVVGSHGRSALSRTILGSVSQRVTNDARCSVRVVRAPARKRHSAAHILIGFDGSPDAEAAVNAVAER